MRKVNKQGLFLAKASPLVWGEALPGASCSTECTTKTLFLRFLLNTRFLAPSEMRTGRLFPAAS